MARIAIACTACQKPLAGGTDTFGDIWQPFCWICYAELNSGPQGQWYGLAPHHHDLSITGSIIGSTVFDPLPEPNANGEYVMGDQTFMPDPHAPGLGIWEQRALPGWR
ncbi:MAG: hypothetical protein IT328_23965 [Caldilineaceae bacterium]|nr:hypothetical protein [Caldilineaceae bacterium]